MPLENSVLEDSRDDLSYKSFISYLTNIHFMLSNNMNLKVVSDRNLIDSLTYNVQQYKRDALIWENIYLELVEYLMTRHLAKSFHIVKSYAENEDCIIKEILSIIK